MVVVVTNEFNIALSFPEAGNLNGTNADLCSDVAGPSSSGSGDLFEPSERSNETIILLFSPLLSLLAAILDFSMTSTPILASGSVTSLCIRAIGIPKDAKRETNLPKKSRFLPAGSRTFDGGLPRICLNKKQT